MEIYLVSLYPFNFNIIKGGSIFSDAEQQAKTLSN